MLPGLVGAVLLVGLVVGPLLWRVWDDRRKDNALRVRADLHMVLFRALQGDSFVSIDALPPTLWRPGRVVLNAPSDWQSVLRDRVAGDRGSGAGRLGGRDQADATDRYARAGPGAATRGVSGIGAG